MADDKNTIQDQNLGSADIHTIPKEFYGGVRSGVPQVKKTALQAQREALPPPPSAPLVPTARTAPSGASAPAATPAPARASAPARFSPKAVLAISAGIFVLCIAGISYYYVNQAAQLRKKLAVPVAATPFPALPVPPPPPPPPVSATATPPAATSTAQALQPLAGVVFPQKTYSIAVDSDNDGLTDAEEALYGTDPHKPDTDGDGYIDGLEVENLYDPLRGAGARLINSGLVKVYLNPSFNYSIYYPSAWSPQSLDTTNQEVLFSTGTGEYIEVIKVDNPLKLSVTDWYLGQSPGTASSSLKQVVTKAHAAGIMSPDGLTAYLPFGDAIYAIAYNIGLSDTVAYLTTFKMMINSFRYPGVFEQGPSVVSAPVSSTSTQASSSPPSPFAAQMPVPATSTASSSSATHP